MRRARHRCLTIDLPPENWGQGDVQMYTEPCAIISPWLFIPLRVFISHAGHSRDHLPHSVHLRPALQGVVSPGLRVSIPAPGLRLGRPTVRLDPRKDNDDVVRLPPTLEAEVVHRF